MLNPQILDRLPFERNYNYTDNQIVIFRRLTQLFSVSEKHAQKQTRMLPEEELPLFKQYYTDATNYELAIEAQMQEIADNIKYNEKEIQRHDKNIENIIKNENVLINQFGRNFGDQLGHDLSTLSPSNNDPHEKKKKKEGWFSRHFRK